MECADSAPSVLSASSVVKLPENVRGRGGRIWNPQRGTITRTTARNREISVALSGLGNDWTFTQGGARRLALPRAILCRAFSPLSLSLVTSAATAAIRADRNGNLFTAKNAQIAEKTGLHSMCLAFFAVDPSAGLDARQRVPTLVDGIRLLTPALSSFEEEREKIVGTFGPERRSFYVACPGLFSFGPSALSV